MSHGFVSFILCLSPFISVTSILYPAPWPSCLGETGQREGCSPAAWMQTGPLAYADWPAARGQQNMQGMKFSGSFHLLYSGHTFHKTYIWDPSFLSSSHPSTHNWMILNIGSQLNMRSNQINQHSCRNLISFGNQDKNPVARILKVQGRDSPANDATNNSYRGCSWMPFD